MLKYVSILTKLSHDFGLSAVWLLMFSLHLQHFSVVSIVCMCVCVVVYTGGGAFVTEFLARYCGVDFVTKTRFLVTRC